MAQPNTPGFVEAKRDPNEDITIRRKRLRFRSWHRGIKEADLLFGQFADKYIHSLSNAKLDMYEEIMREQDSDLVSWITGGSMPPEYLQNSVMTMLQQLDYIDIVK